MTGSGGGLMVSIGLVLLLLVVVWCGLVWVLLLGPRLGALLSVSGVIGMLLALVFAVLLVTPFLPVDMVWVVGGLLVTVGALGTALLRRRRQRRDATRRGARARALWLPALAGGVVWAATLGLAQVVPGASRLSWAMNGDTANNIHFARQVIEHNGVLVGVELNPVPLPAGVLGLAMAAGSPSGGASLAADLSSFAVVWVAVLALLCLVTGAAVAALVSARAPRVVAVTSAIGSLVPLTPFVAGLPIEYGYFNAHIALVLAIVAWLVYLGSDRAPLAAAGILCLIATLMLVTWSPLVLLPAAFGAALAIRQRAVLRSLRGPRLAVFAASVLQLVAYFEIVTLPALLAHQGAFETEGHGYPSTWWVLPPLVATAIALAVLVRRHPGTPVLSSVVAMVAATLVALAALLVMARDGSDPWVSYYPSKLSWLVSVLLGITVAALLVAAVQARVRRTAITAAVAVVALVAVGLVQPVTGFGRTVGQPVARILSGDAWYTGDRAVTRILELSDPATPGILWQSGDPDEAMINFWTIEFTGGDFAGSSALRAFSFAAYRAYRATGTYDTSTVADLCAVLPELAPSAVVHTENAGLADELAEQCADARVTVSIG